MRYFLRRLGFYAFAAWAALTVNFFLPRLMPGNPVEVLLARLKGHLTPQATHALMLQFGLTNQSGLIPQYFSYLNQLAHGQFGTSITYFPTPVLSVIAEALPWTLVLVGVSTVISFVLGTALGIIVGWRRGSRLDVLLPVTTFFSAIPYFWLALLAIMVFGYVLGWFPTSGGYALGTTIGLNGPFLTSALSHAVLPALTIVVSSIAGWLLSMRNMMVGVLGEDYVALAEAKGLSGSRVMMVYGARNAILPNIANFALSLGFIVSGAILTEAVFAYPGIGYLLYEAVSNEDFPLAQAIFLVITIAVLLANLLADFLYGALDPRARQSG
ncbi:MAG: ABC transporter permease [Streptosporangiaceae bacterium]